MTREYIETEVLQLEKDEDAKDLLWQTYRVREVRMLGKDHCVIVLSLLTQDEADLPTDPTAASRKCPHCKKEHGNQQAR